MRSPTAPAHASTSVSRGLAPGASSLNGPRAGRRYDLTVLALLVVLFIAELWVIVLVAESIGVLNTIGLLILISIVGVWLVKRQGLAVLDRVRTTLDQGRVPQREMVDGFLILLAGILLIPPGFITDAVGSAPPAAAGARGDSRTAPSQPGPAIDEWPCG